MAEITHPPCKAVTRGRTYGILIHCEKIACTPTHIWAGIMCKNTQTFWSTPGWNRNNFSPMSARLGQNFFFWYVLTVIHQLMLHWNLKIEREFLASPFFNMIILCNSITSFSRDFVVFSRSNSLINGVTLGGEPIQLNQVILSLPFLNWILPDCPEILQGDIRNMYSLQETFVSSKNKHFWPNYGNVTLGGGATLAGGWLTVRDSKFKGLFD